MPEIALPQKQLVAVIDIGSSAIRMVIAEVGAKKDEIKPLEKLQKPVPFGKDVFLNGAVGRTAMRDGVAVLNGFKSVIDSYGIQKVHAVATSAIRDATNRDNFIDQVYVRTGIDVEVIDGAEENRLELIAVEHALGGKFDYDKKNCLIIEVGSGSTEIIILNQGEVQLTRTLSIGSVRLPDQAVAGKTNPTVMQRVLKRSIHEIAEYAAREYNLGEIDTFIALGGDMRLAAAQVTSPLPEDFVTLEKKPFLELVESLSKLSPDEIADKFGILYAEAESLFPALLFYANFLGETKAEQVVLPMVSIRDGLLLEEAQMLSGYKRTDVAKQVLSSAKRLGKKYHYEEAHSLCVAGLAVKLFDHLKAEHGLGTRERLLLEVSALLHAVGMFISPTNYHKHSSYLVEAAEIFGLRKADKNIVCQVVRYHRGSHPRTSHEPYMSLPRRDRSIVSKLASILRVACAMDKSRQLKIRNFSLEHSGEAYILWVPEDIGDITLERDSVANRGVLFSEVFGAGISLKQGAPPKNSQ
jgi:exopolyphosphatase/guanosine-5'-triphosphate,3'-diphosphate pyrophosphatase